MSLARVAAIALAIVILSPSAAAVDPSGMLRAPSGSQAEGLATALFALVHERAFSFNAHAASVTLDVDYANYTEVPSPAGGRPLYTQLEPLRHETRVLGPSQLDFAGARAGAGFLVLDSSGAMTAAARHAAPLQIRSVSDIALDSDSATSSTGGHWEIHEALPGTLVEMKGGQVDYDVRGTFILEMYEMDYQVTTGGGQSLQRTGEFVETDASAVRHGRYEIDRLTLRDATLHVHAPGDAVLYSASTTLKVPAGAVLDVLDSAGRPTGQTRAVGSDGVRLDDAFAATASSQASSSTAVNGFPTWLALAIGILALGAVGISALRRRAKRDDFAMAVHAMEERRFADALPSLRRLRAKRPADAAILLDEAICLEETGELQRARAAYEATLAAWPTHAEAHYFLARTLARLRLAAEAARHLTRALELDPRLDELARRDALLSQLPGESGVSI